MHKLILLILILTLMLNPAATLMPQVQQGPTFKVYSDLVLVDVVVNDKKGNPIRNLAKKDFHVFEDGVEQSIQIFRFEDISQFEAERAKEPAPAPPAPAVASPPVQKTLASQKADEARYSNRRLIVMMFDLSSLDIPDAIFARKSAEEFIHTKISPADLVAIVVMAATLRVAQDFTSDQNLLIAALNKLKLGQSSELTAQAPTDTTSNDITGTSENTNEDTSATA